MRKLAAERGVQALGDLRVVVVPHAAVQDDLVAGPDVVTSASDGLDDAGGVAAAEVEAGLVTALAPLLVQADDVDGNAEGGPDVVVVHARGHDVDEHVLGAELRHGNDFARKASTGWP